MVKASEPAHRQLFIGRPKTMKEQDEFERKVFVIRKVGSNVI
jgi:glutamate synthase (NADPH/NADH) large chain